MAKDGSVQRQSPLQSLFSTSRLTICITVVRLLLIFDLIPEEISFFLHLPAVRSTLVRTRETRRYLQVAAAFRRLFPSFSQAYIASTSPPPVLVWAAHFESEKWWFPISDYWRHVLWGLGLLLVDYMISRILERIAVSTLEQENGNKEEELQSKLPEAIQPPRAHVFEISSSSNQSEDSNAAPLLTTADIPMLAANLYYASPITMLASGTYDCFQNIWCFLLLWSIYEMIYNTKKKPRVLLAALALALATYGQPWSIAFAVPICISQPTSRRTTVFAGLFLACLLWLQMLSFLLVGTEAYWSWKPMRALTPNLGPLWYFQMQLFDRFHDYFALMFTGLPYLIVLPLTIRLYRYPIVLITCLWFVGTLFQHNPTLFDFNVALSLLIMSPRSCARMTQVSLIAMCSIPVPLLLYVLDYGLWLETGSGNANYIFFQCLAYNAFCAMIFLDFCNASLQRDKALRMTKKLSLLEPPEAKEEEEDLQEESKS